MTRNLLLAAVLVLMPLAGASSHLAVVTDVAVEPGNQVLRITWSAVPDADGYVVDVYADGDRVQRINASGTEATFRGVNERAYAVQVAARADDGTLGPFSDPVAGVPRHPNDQAFLAVGLIIVWVALWGYTLILDRVERNLRAEESKSPPASSEDRS